MPGLCTWCSTNGGQGQLSWRLSCCRKPKPPPQKPPLPSPPLVAPPLLSPPPPQHQHQHSILLWQTPQTINAAVPQRHQLQILSLVALGPFHPRVVAVLQHLLLHKTRSNWKHSSKYGGVKKHRVVCMHVCYGKLVKFM